MSDYQVICEAEHDCDDKTASFCMAALCEAYPGHPWHVSIRGGLLIIKHMKLSNQCGMVLKYQEVVHDARKLKHGVVFAGGELLERAGLVRGARRDGEVTPAVEGIEQRHTVPVALQ